MCNIEFLIKTYEIEENRYNRQISRAKDAIGILGIVMAFQFNFLYSTEIVKKQVDGKNYWFIGLIIITTIIGLFALIQYFCIFRTQKRQNFPIFMKETEEASMILDLDKIIKINQDSNDSLGLKVNKADYVLMVWLIVSFLGHFVFLCNNFKLV